MASTPRRVCLKSDYLKLKGTTFAKWLQDSNNLYINKNLAKYPSFSGLSFQNETYKILETFFPQFNFNESSDTIREKP